MRRCVRLACASLFIALAPAVAAAQIKLEKSEPGEAVNLATAPTALRFWFSEAPSGRHTRFKLTDGDGYLVYLGSIKNFDNDERSLIVPIAGRLTPGQYYINWSSMGADSAAVSGRIKFRVLGVEEARIAAAADSQVMHPVEDKKVLVRPDEDNGAAATPMYSIARALSYVALIVIIGAPIFRTGVVSRVPTRGGKSFDPQIEAAMAPKAAIACGVFLFVALIRLFLQHRVMVSGLQGNTASLHLGFMSLATSWGRIWLIECGMVFASLVGFLLAIWRIPGGWVLSLVSGFVLIFVGPLSGHAGATQQAVLQSAFFGALHLAGIAGWLGCTFWLSVAGLPALRSSGEARARRVADLVNVFAPIALTSGAVLVIAGAYSAWLRLGNVQALWTTSYGITLIVKLVAVLITAAIVDINWQRAKPSLGRRGASAMLAQSLRKELLLALAVVVITAILAGLPSPSR